MEIYISLIDNWPDQFFFFLLQHLKIFLLKVFQHAGVVWKSFDPDFQIIVLWCVSLDIFFLIRILKTNDDVD